MKTKSAHTKEFILEKVAPIFNKKGYQATSLSDLTDITKLTKGAIYGNFESKEDLATKAFKYNINRILKPMNEELEKHSHAINKLFAITNYYREYYDFVLHYGGCPILNVASDTNNVNSKLFQVVKDLAKKIENNLVDLIQNGIDKDEIKIEVNARTISKNMYSMIEGSIFMAFVHKDKNYILEMMNLIDIMIKEKLICH